MESTLNMTSPVNRITIHNLESLPPQRHTSQAFFHPPHPFHTPASLSKAKNQDH